MPDTPHTVPPPTSPAGAAEGYKPIAGVAIAALAVGALTAAIVMGIAIASLAKGRGILAESVVYLAVFGLVLSLAARWQIRRSQGTRAGLKLTTAGIWLCVLFGFGYGAVLFATHLAVGWQAQDAADQWFGLLAAGQPELAFRRTRDPSQQRSIPENPDAIRRRFGATEMTGFNASELSRQYRTWKEKVEVSCLGVKQLQTTPVGYDVDLNYQLRSPEGRFDVAVGALGYDDPETGKRNWQIVFMRSRIQDRQFTRLGRMCDELKYEYARRFLPRWAAEFSAAPASQIVLLRIDGNVPPEQQREAIIKELSVPGAINLAAGGAVSPMIPPNLRIEADGVRLVSYVEFALPTLGNEPIPTYITVQVTSDQLVKDMIGLQKPGWEQQSTQSTWDILLKDVPEFKVLEVNVRPGAPREGSQPRSVQVPG